MDACRRRLSLSLSSRYSMEYGLTSISKLHIDTETWWSDSFFCLMSEIFSWLEVLTGAVPRFVDVVDLRSPPRHFEEALFSSCAHGEATRCICLIFDSHIALGQGTFTAALAGSLFFTCRLRCGETARPPAAAGKISDEAERISTPTRCRYYTKRKRLTFGSPSTTKWAPGAMQRGL